MAVVSSQGKLDGTFGLSEETNPLEQLSVVGVGNINVVVGGNVAQGFSGDGKLLWSTTLPGYVTRGATTTVDDVLVTVTSDGFKDGKSRVVFVAADTGKVIASPSTAEVLAGDVAAANGVVVLTADHLKGAPATATGYSPSGVKLWERKVYDRTRRAQAVGSGVLLTTLPDFAPDNTPTTAGKVTLIDPSTGRSVATINAKFALFDSPPVVAGDRFWVLTDDQAWSEFDSSGRPTGDRRDERMVGGGTHAYHWVAGWAQGSAPAARVGSGAVVSDEDAGSTVWDDTTQPFPRVVTRPSDGTVRAYVPAPGESRLAPATVLREQSVTALACEPSGGARDVCSVTTWRLPR